jgi:alkylated DNA repair protein (DNA oxidative demethylase)
VKKQTGPRQNGAAPQGKRGAPNRAVRGAQPPRRVGVPAAGLHYNRSFLTRSDRDDIVAWLGSIRPIWENKFSKHNPPPAGDTQRRLLRPTYWLGNWQFACLRYYMPPKGIENRCVRAEPFPPVLRRLVDKIERTVRQMFRGDDLPPGWHFNTCLVNFYGNRIENGKPLDCARVGEHKDLEPGPVASISLGERALFQFVESRGHGAKSAVVVEQWLDDGSLQIFGGQRWKSDLFHRVQRVDGRGGENFPIAVEDFETRRINFTFRYVPDEHIVPFRRLATAAREDVREYVEQLAEHSPFFAGELG